MAGSGRPYLEDLDWAVEHDFARQDGESFDPTFFLSGERQPEGEYRLDDDVFIDRIVRSLPPAVTFSWRGQSYRAPVAPEAELPCFLTVEGVADTAGRRSGCGAARKPGVRDLLGQGEVFQATVRVSD